MSTTSFCVYNEFDKIVKLSKNERFKEEDSNQKRFRQVLLNMRNGGCTENDCNFLLPRTPDLNKNIINAEEYLKLSFSNEKVANNNKIK